MSIITSNSMEASFGKPGTTHASVRSAASRFAARGASISERGGLDG